MSEKEEFNLEISPEEMEKITGGWVHVNYKERKYEVIDERTGRVRAVFDTQKEAAIWAFNHANRTAVIDDPQLRSLREKGHI